MAFQDQTPERLAYRCGSTKAVYPRSNCRQRTLTNYVFERSAAGAANPAAQERPFPESEMNSATPTGNGSVSGRNGPILGIRTIRFLRFSIRAPSWH